MSSCPQADELIVTYVDALGGEVLFRAFDFSKITQIRDLGETISSILSLEVVVTGNSSGNALPTDISATNASIDPTGTMVNFTLTNVSAAALNTYQIVVRVQLSSGEGPIIAGMNVAVEAP